MFLAKSGCVARITLDEESVDAAGVQAVLPGNSLSVGFSPDGQLIATPRETLLTKEDGRRAIGFIIPVVSVESGEVLHTLQLDETALHVGSPVTSPKWADGKLKRTDSNVAFSADGTLLSASLWQDDSHVVYLWNVETGERRWRVRVENCPTPVFSIDGHVLCTERRIAITDGTIKTLGKSDGLQQPDTVQTALALSLSQPQAISPDQTLRAEKEPPGDYLQIDKLTQGTEETLAVVKSDSDDYLEQSLLFSPDSQQLIIMAHGKDVLYLWQRGSKTLEKLAFNSRESSYLVWSQNGDHLGLVMSGDRQNTLHVYELDELPRL
ncbi:MAG: hypothetical protein AAF716_11450 [Cyanobacteria bacterium P01_D01_bin.1]